jgi:hypothetical protein
MKHLFRREKSPAQGQEAEKQKKRSLPLMALEAVAIGLVVWTTASAFMPIRPPQRLISPTQRADFEKFKDVCSSAALAAGPSSRESSDSDVYLAAIKPDMEKQNSVTECAETLYRNAVFEAMTRRPDLWDSEGVVSTFRYLVETSVLQSVDLDSAYPSSFFESKKAMDSLLKKKM